MRAITISAGLADGYTLGEALDFLGDIVKQEMPQARIDYKGQSADFKDSTQSVNFTFILALLVVFLVLAAQFESFIHPLVIMLTVPLAVFGALLGLYFMGQSINIYSQIGIVMLIGLATKNGILIVEFTNQLRDKGLEFKAALLQASQQRLRPILMTAITTIMGAVPLILAQGAGAESRLVIGVVIFSGVGFATFFTLFVVPVAYWLLARHTQSPNAVAHKLEALELELKSEKSAHSQ
jgi:multidrug efflux pump